MTLMCMYYQRSEEMNGDAGMAVALLASYGSRQVREGSVRPVCTVYVSTLARDFTKNMERTMQVELDLWDIEAFDSLGKGPDEE